MIKLVKSTEPLGKTIQIVKKASENVPAPIIKIVNEAQNLNYLPHYQVSSNTVLASAFKTLNEFSREFGEVKSATLMCEEIKRAKKNNCGDDVIDKLETVRFEYAKRIKAMRKKIWQEPVKSFDEYVNRLRRYLKENGTYLNCSECADLTLDGLRKKGINANNVLMYTVNNSGNRTSYVEHVFTLAGLKSDAKIQDPSSWGEAVICDGWAGISMPANGALKYYEKFFDLDPNKHKIMFQFFNKE